MTIFTTLNKLLEYEVYNSQDELESLQIIVPNRVTYEIV